MGRHHHNALVSTELFYLLWFYLLWQVMGRHAMLWLLPIEGAGPTVDAARWEAPSWEALLGAPQLATPASWGWHGWLRVMSCTLEKRSCRSEPNETLRR